jgi:hypothetical protein
MMWLLPAAQGCRAQIIVIMTYVVALGAQLEKTGTSGTSITVANAGT